MNQSIIPSDQWEACPSGELMSLARKLKARRRDRTAARIVGTTGAILLVFFIVGLVAHRMRDFNDNRLGNISCEEVKANLDDYAAGQLDEHLADHIRVHLAECPGCAAIHQDLGGEVTVHGDALNAVRSPRSETVPREFTAPIALARR